MSLASTAPTAESALNPTDPTYLTPTTSTMSNNPFQPRRSERHHLAVAKDLLDDLFNDDDDDMGDFDDAVMNEDGNTEDVGDALHAPQFAFCI